MQILLASFAVMSLVFAGCNAKKADEKMEVKEEATVTEETTPAVEVVTEGDVTVEVDATETTTAQ